MSIKVMTHVWDGFPGSGSELLMMLALADRCDEEGGRLWPSVLTLARRCRVSESMARRILRSLEQKGYLSVVGNHYGGKPGTTRQYQLNVTMIAREAANDLPHITAKPKGQRKLEGECADARGGIDATPGMDVLNGAHGCTTTGGMDTSLSHNKHPLNNLKDRASAEAPVQPAACSLSGSDSDTGSIFDAASVATSVSSSSQASLSGKDDMVGKPPKKAGKAKATKGPAVDVGMLSLPSWLEPERLQAFVDNRRDLKKPMTIRAVELLIKELEALRLAGHDPHLALDTSILKGWTSVYAPSTNSSRPSTHKFNPRDFANSGNRSPSHVTDDDFIDGHAVRVD